MNNPTSENANLLTLDFGMVGYQTKDNEAFKLQLGAGQLFRLFEHTRVAKRIPELYLIQRPGDLWDYIWVMLDQSPASLAERIAEVRQNFAPHTSLLPHPWPENCIPYSVFDDLFQYYGDDSDPYENAWIENRQSPAIKAFMEQLFDLCCIARDALDRSDPLIRHICSQLEAGQHLYLLRRRTELVNDGLQMRLEYRFHSQEFRDKLAELLTDPELDSVSYSGNGEIALYHQLATEQRRRCDIKGGRPRDALFLSALTDCKLNNDDWESEIFWRSEGISYGELYIQGNGVIGTDWFGRHGVKFRDVLTVRDQGEVDGFSKSNGIGWIHYKNSDPPSRATSKEMADDWR